MKRAKKITGYIFAFILSLLVIAVFILGYINSLLFNEVSIRTSMRDTNYYYNIYSIINDIANDYVLQSGFDNKVLDGVITEYQVQEDINKVVDGLYNNKKIELNTDGVEKKLHENIQKQIEEEKHNVDESAKADIKEFEESVIDAYKTNIFYSEEVINSIKSYMQKIHKILNIAVIILCVVILVLALIMFKVYEPSIGVGLMIAGVFLIIIKGFSVINLAINNILILNWAFSRTLTYILNNLVQRIFVTGIIVTIIGVTSMLLSEFMRHRPKRKEK